MATKRTKVTIYLDEESEILLEWYHKQRNKSEAVRQILVDLAETFGAVDYVDARLSGKIPAFKDFMNQIPTPNVPNTVVSNGVQQVQQVQQVEAVQQVQQVQQVEAVQQVQQVEAVQQVQQVQQVEAVQQVQQIETVQQVQPVLQHQTSLSQHQTSLAQHQTSLSQHQTSLAQPIQTEQSAPTVKGKKLNKDYALYL